MTRKLLFKQLLEDLLALTCSSSIQGDLVSYFFLPIWLKSMRIYQLQPLKL